MKATEVIQQYRNGQPNFQRLNLRGANFKGQDLSGADFSYCQIQSANFSQANLTNAKFIGAKAGVKKGWIILLLYAGMHFIIFSSLLLGLVGYLISIIPNDTEVAWLGLITLIIFCTISFLQNIGRGLVAILFFLTIPLLSLSENSSKIKRATNC